MHSPPRGGKNNFLAAQRNFFAIIYENVMPISLKKLAGMTVQFLNQTYGLFLFDLKIIAQDFRCQLS